MDKISPLFFVPFRIRLQIGRLQRLHRGKKMAYIYEIKMRGVVGHGLSTLGVCAIRCHAKRREVVQQRARGMWWVVMDMRFYPFYISIRDPG